jgi:DNA-directed RNA polymerase subunit RPC12/RpoP
MSDKIKSLFGQPNESTPQTPSQGTPLNNFHIQEAPYVECENCGGKVFHERMMIKKISKFITGGQHDSIVPFPVIACSSCNHVNELFKPQI